MISQGKINKCIRFYREINIQGKIGYIILVILLKYRVGEEGKRADPDPFYSSDTVPKNRKRGARGGRGGQTTTSGAHKDHNISHLLSFFVVE